MLSVIRRWWASADRLSTVGAASNTIGILENSLDILRVHEGKRQANYRIDRRVLWQYEGPKKSQAPPIRDPGYRNKEFTATYQRSKRLHKKEH